MIDKSQVEGYTLRGLHLGKNIINLKSDSLVFSNEKNILEGKSNAGTQILAGLSIWG